MNHYSRRQFGKALAASSVFSLLPGRAQTNAKKVNMAFIGCGAQGEGDGFNFIKTGLVNVVALCDVQFGTKHTAKIEDACKEAKKFTDFREMFDKMAKDIDACLIATPDHAHFPIAMLAMSLGKAVYVEKPLAHTYDECRRMMAAEKKYKVVTQMGNQGHSGPNYFQFKSWTEAGIIKDITKITAYMNSERRWHKWGEIKGFPKGGKVPEGMNWDAWLGTAMENDFSDKLHPGDWRSWFAYGNGAFGDWGPHILDTSHRFLKLGMPEKVSAVKRITPNEWIFPMGSTIRFDFPKRGDMPPVEVTWHDGVANVPEYPAELGLTKLEKNGKILYGKDLTFKGTTHGNPLRIVPEAKMQELAATLPRVTGKNSDHYLNFVKAVLGEEEARSPFSVSAPLSQVFCLGVIAQRLGGELKFDREKETFEDATANQLLVGPPPRKGWEQFYTL